MRCCALTSDNPFDHWHVLKFEPLLNRDALIPNNTYKELEMPNLGRRRFCTFEQLSIFRILELNGVHSFLLKM